MRGSKVRHKFRAKAEEERFGKTVRGWKIEIFIFSLVILISFSQYHKLPKKEVFSYWFGVPLVGVVLLYFLISSISNWFALHLDRRDREINNLRRQLTRFICETSFGWVEKEDLKRLKKAADLFPLPKENDLTIDDFSLISRPDIFWGKNGFEWQDEAECANCGHTRKEHSQDGNCPTE